MLDPWRGKGGGCGRNIPRTGGLRLGPPNWTRLVADDAYAGFQPAVARL